MYGCSDFQSNNINKHLDVVLLADGKHFIYLGVIFIQLTFKQSSINE